MYTKYFTVALSVLLTAQITVSQEISKTLDNHRRFKTICLDDDISKWSDQSHLQETKGDNELYRIEAVGELSKLFDLPVEYLYAHVTGGKIYHISVYTKKIQESMTDLDVGMNRFVGVQVKLEQLFGKFYGLDHPDNVDYFMICQWRGERTVLNLKYIYYGVEKGDRLVIEIIDLNNSMSQLKKGI